MSQEKLGALLGITFQQVQKYEKGTNRVGASRLQAIAEILGMPVSFFFDELPWREDDKRALGAVEVSPFFTSAEGLQLNRALVKITDARVRQLIIDLVTGLAEASK